MRGIVQASFGGVFVVVVWLAMMASTAVPIEMGVVDRMKLQVNVRPRILLNGGAVRVECRVPLIDSYESVEWGIEPDNSATNPFERVSGETLFRCKRAKGDHLWRPPRPCWRVIFATVTEIPVTACGTHYAFCRVTQSDRLGIVEATPATLLLKGFNCPEEP